MTLTTISGVSNILGSPLDPFTFFISHLPLRTLSEEKRNSFIISFLNSFDFSLDTSVICASSKQTFKVQC